MSSDEDSFYEDDEDPQDLWAAYEAAVERGEVVRTACPDDSGSQARVTKVGANYVAVTAPANVTTGLYGHLGAFSPVRVLRSNTGSTSVRGTVQG